MAQSDEILKAAVSHCEAISMGAVKTKIFQEDKESEHLPDLFVGSGFAQDS
jgi:hypothetical protein